MFPPQSIEATVNISVQQIYNEYKWHWLFLDEAIETFLPLGELYTGAVTNPIKYILGLEYTDTSSEVIEMFPEHSRTGINETTYTVVDQNLVLFAEHDYTLTYLKDYSFLGYVANPTTEIPIPDGFIPALYYLVLSQIDMVDVQQLQGQPTNNFNKYQYEMKNLKENDMGYAAQLVGANPQ